MGNEWYNIKKRELKHVIKFWEESKDSELQRLFSFQNNTLEETIKLYEDSLLENAKSYGETIYVDDCYVGDIWCYSIDETYEKNCFISIVIFDKNYWNRGIATIALSEFNKIIANKYAINRICAFTYKFNMASRNLLEKNNFKYVEEFKEDNIESLYYELKI